MTYLSRGTLVSFVFRDILDEEPVYLVDKNAERLIEQFNKVLTEKQSAIVADVLKRHPHPLDFQILHGEVKKQ